MKFDKAFRCAFIDGAIYGAVFLAVCSFVGFVNGSLVWLLVNGSTETRIIVAIAIYCGIAFGFKQGKKSLQRSREKAAKQNAIEAER